MMVVLINEASRWKLTSNLSLVGMNRVELLIFEDQRSTNIELPTVRAYLVSPIDRTTYRARTNRRLCLISNRLLYLDRLSGSCAPAALGSGLPRTTERL